MPKFLTQYRIFIGSPGGLEEERRLFSKTLEKYTRRDAEPRGVTFHPVGWEDTIGGVGRPQALINEDLKQCDYAVFLLHDRWGTQTGGGYSSGTEEEWALAEQLYEQTKIRNIALFFKEVELARLKDPGPQLARVLDFKGRIESGKKYLFKSYILTGDFGELLEAQLAKWLRDHEGATNAQSSGDLVPSSPPTVTEPSVMPTTTPVGPSFDYWIAEADKLMKAEAANYSGALFCAEKALAEASTDMEWALAKDWLGLAQLRLNNLDESIAAYAEIVERFNLATDSDRRGLTARALYNKGVVLGKLGRREEEVVVYEEILARFGSASELALRRLVFSALINKGVALGQLGHREEEVAAYDDLIDRFTSAPELPLREDFARALINKAIALDHLGLWEDAIAVYDDALARFGSAFELPLREQIGKALINKGIALGQLGRSEDAIAVFDEVIARFSSARELSLQEQFAKAFVNKGVALGLLGRTEEEVALYDEVITRFGSASELPLRERVARSLVNKGVRLGQLGRREEEVAVYDDVLARFGTASELSLREQVARALVNKGLTLGGLGRSEDAVAVYDDVIARFSPAPEAPLREQVARAAANKEKLKTSSSS